MRMRKTNWILEQTEQKHLKKQKSCRDQRPKVAKQTKRDGRKISEKAPTKVRYSRSTKKEEKQRRVEKKLSLPPPLLVVSSFRKKRARQKWWCVFDRWKVSSLVSHSKRALKRHKWSYKRRRSSRWCARIFCALKAGASSGFFFPAEHRIRVCYALVLEEDKERDSHE